MFSELMGIIQKEALRITLLSYAGIGIGTLNRAVLFVICFTTEQIGLVNIIVATGLLFAQVANLGSIAGILKFFPYFKNNKNRHYGFVSLMLIYVFVGVLICLGVFLGFKSVIQGLYLERSPMIIEYYFWVIPIGVSYVVFQFFEALLRSRQKNILAVFIFEVLLRLIITFLLIILLLKFISFEQFVILNSSIYVIPTLILLIYSIKIGEFSLTFKKISISKKYQKILIQYSIFMYINNLGILLISNLDIMMIAKYLGLSETGIYSTIFFVVSAILIPFKSIVKISIPIVAEQWKYKRMDEMESLYKKVSSVSLLIGSFFFLIIWLNVDFLFAIPGKEFLTGKWVFFFLMLGRLTDMYCGINSVIFLTSKKYKFEAFFTLVMIFAIYFLNLWLIPSLGMVGAAISTGLTIIIYNLVRLIFIYKIYKIHPFAKKQINLILLGLLTFLVGEAISEIVSNGILLLLIETCIVFLCFLLPIYVFKIEEESVNYANKFIAILKSKLVKS
ncbi:MAG: oligosaccharide flippase family protein [Bacteroidetes bacterium]|nr:oligosaccharide flippase family protein [Bacteroidota bacterium]